jgi:hypothetical protein
MHQRRSFVHSFSRAGFAQASCPIIQTYSEAESKLSEPKTCPIHTCVDVAFPPWPDDYASGNLENVCTNCRGLVLYALSPSSTEILGRPRGIAPFVERFLAVFPAGRYQSILYNDAIRSGLGGPGALRAKLQPTAVDRGLAWIDKVFQGRMCFSYSFGVCLANNPHA